MTPQIEITSLDKHYGDFHALKDINLTIPKGAFTALVGPSGCGKSTLLRCIAGLESITSGTLQIAGETINDMPPRKRDVAMVFQSYALYPHMNVLGNLTYSLRFKGFGKEAARKKANEVAQVIGLETLLERYPRELSGGQRQRVAIARALVLRPKFIVLDEPTSALDRSVQAQIIDLLRGLQEKYKLAYLFISHDLKVVRAISNHVIVMRNGKVVEQGPADQIFDHPKEDYTKALMAAAFDLAAVGAGDSVAT